MPTVTTFSDAQASSLPDCHVARTGREPTSNLVAIYLRIVQVGMSLHADMSCEFVTTFCPPLYELFPPPVSCSLHEDPGSEGLFCFTSDSGSYSCDEQTAARCAPGNIIFPPGLKLSFVKSVLPPALDPMVE